jgi:cytidyltransferase-like protein
MIVAWENLGELASRVVMVDGSFDPLHDGHIAYFAAASELGYPVLCNITSDSLTRRKHPVLLPQRRRAIVISVIQHLSYVHCADVSTLEVLERLRPVVYVKGNDWLARGGIPTEEAELCKDLSIEVKYVDTVLNSSTRLIADLRAH